MHAGRVDWCSFDEHGEEYFMDLVVVGSGLLV